MTKQPTGRTLLIKLLLPVLALMIFAVDTALSIQNHGSGLHTGIAAVLTVVSFTNLYLIVQRFGATMKGSRVKK